MIPIQTMGRHHVEEGQGEGKRQEVAETPMSGSHHLLSARNSTELTLRVFPKRKVGSLAKDSFAVSANLHALMSVL